MKKWAPFLAFAAIVLTAAAYSNSFVDGIFTGGAYGSDIALPMWGTNMNATVQISRNDTGDGGGQGSALDVYASGKDSIGGFVQRWFIDVTGVDGGKAASMTFDYGGSLRVTGSIIASGIMKDHFSTGYAAQAINPYDDGSMVAAWTDETYGSSFVGAANPYASEGVAGAQAFIALDGQIVDAGIGEFKPNVRFAIDGISGALRWSNSTANRYRDATWDAKFGRISANILGDPSTSLEALHLVQASGKHDSAGTVALVGVNNNSVNFGTAYGTAPVCVATPIANPGGVTYWVTSTTTSVKVSASAAPANLTFDYHCYGNPN